MSYWPIRKSAPQDRGARDAGVPTPAGNGPRLVLWDLDGTLLDSLQSVRETMNTVLLEQRLQGFTAEEIKKLIGNPLRKILAERCADEAVVEGMTHRYREVYMESGWVTVKFHPDTIELVRELRMQGWLQGIVTSKGQEEAEVLMRDLGIFDLWDVIIGDDDKRPLKPDPAPVLAAAHRLDLPLARTAMVGDTTFDVACAKAAGAYALGVTWGMHDRATLAGAGADGLARDADEAGRLLQEWARER